jgi:type IV pilus assembly protein PilZ
MTNSDDDDRRAEMRAPIELKVEYERLNSFFADYTKNISRGGTFVRTSRPLDVGTEFVFKLGVPTLPQPLVLTGKVQWVVQEHEATEEQEPGMGISFVFESEAERAHIEGTVEQLMQREFGPALSEMLRARGAS